MSEASLAPVLAGADTRPPDPPAAEARPPARARAGKVAIHA
jgi:hypothetical protein